VLGVMLTLVVGAILRFPRDRFDFLWLIASSALPAFDESGLGLIGSKGDDWLYTVIPPVTFESSGKLPWMEADE
jgi:hypothetical protein